METAHRAVGADVAVAVAQGVQRVQADEGGARVAGEGEELAEVREVADAPVPRAAHRVQARREARDALPAQQPLRGRARGRRDDERLLAHALPPGAVRLDAQL